ncbi:MAG: hypothetical protein EHM47_01580 [Ignavibacteriales bacterium]|nr:MAG: hypothetical protein EHM47_01580 [Ignavibacteriales bacterium]
MDNIFEILIYLFIIISFLSSFFRKKKPETKPGGQTIKPPPEPTQVKSSQQEEYDLLKEIEKMFKTESSFPEKQEEITFEKEKSYEPSSEHFDTSEWHQPTPSEHKTIIEQAETWEEKTRKAEAKRKAINEETERRARIFEQHLAVKQGTKSEIRKNIRNSFKNPKTLKEYIVFSEIIGKPKAFQE